MSDSLPFNFDPPVHDVSRVSPTGQPVPPIAPATGVSRHCSAMGAEAAKGFAAQQRERVLDAYAVHGPLTDCEMEAITRIDKSSVTPRRNELIALGLVEKDEGRTRKNPKTGISNTLWRMRVEPGR